MGYGNKSFQSAYDQVKAIRAVARPNFGFVNQLKEFESELEKAPIKDWLGEKK